MRRFEAERGQENKMFLFVRAEGEGTAIALNKF